MEKLFGGVIMNASGIRDSSLEELQELERSHSCAIVTKTCTVHSRSGHPSPRFYESDGFTFNCMGLPNPGLKNMIRMLESIKTDKPKILSVAAEYTEEWDIILKKIGKAKDLIIEINLSCPSLPWFTSDNIMKHLDEELRSRIWGIKLPPLMPKQINKIVKRLNRLSCSYIVCSNTIPGFLLNEKGDPILSRGIGGIGGSTVNKAMALFSISQLRIRLKPSINIIGSGGVKSGKDCYDYLRCGCIAVQVGSEFLGEGPEIFLRLKEELNIILKKSKL